MNYILYNPKANNENNDLNIITVGEESERMAVEKINLLELDVHAFCERLTADDRVLIVGGDGTLHHFANNSYGVDFPCKVCVLRSGTGNDFLNDIGQLDNESLIDIRPYLKGLPKVCVNGSERYFINGVGLGVDGAVCHGVEDYKRTHPNKKANYTVIALKELGFNYKRPTGRVIVDGVVHEYTDIWAMSTMWGKYYGGGMMIAPRQSRESGKVSVMAMHSGSRLKTLGVFTKVKKGAHVKHTEMVDIFEGYDVKVEFDSPCDLQIDGEVVMGVTEYRVLCEKAPTSVSKAEESCETVEPATV